MNMQDLVVRSLMKMVGYLEVMLVWGSRHLMQSYEIARSKGVSNDSYEAQLFMAWTHNDCRPLLCLVKSKNQRLESDSWQWRGATATRRGLG